MSVKIGHALLQDYADKEGFSFKEIKDYPGYFVTTDGRIWGKRKNGFLKPSMVGGYQRVSISRNGVVDNILVHRLVAATFIPNPENKPTVNHKDENTQNNYVENLEWATYVENNNYGTRISRQIESQLNRFDCSKPVVQMNKLGEIIAIYPSSKEAERTTRVRHSHIGDVCNKKPTCKTAGGFKWRWANTSEYIKYCKGDEIICQF